jgi:hypothetical protein
MKQDLWEANSDSTEEPHKITMSELKQKLDQYYEPSIIHKYSSALDILASFIKSQAFLYNESSNECRYRLNLFMFPCIFLSTMCSVFSSISQQYNYGLLIIGAINALLSFLLAIVNYLKLDAAAEAHHISSTHFSRLKILLEFTSGETLLFENPLLQQNGLEKEVEHWTRIHSSIPDMDEERQKFTIQVDEDIKKLKDTLVKNLQEKIDMIREKVIEIRENNRFAIPKRIMNDYPIIYNINIFSFIKTVEDYRLGIISTLKNILNEIHFLGQRETSQREIGQSDNEQTRILQLYERKNNIMNELILLSSTYHLIDIMFQQEIKNNHLYREHRFLFGVQRVLNLFGSKRNVLPDGYKDPYDCGFIDHQRSLLRKILNV